MHLLHVSMHFFHVFLSSHLPFFFSFLHFLVEILSLQMACWIVFPFSEINTKKSFRCYTFQDTLAELICNVCFKKIWTNHSSNTVCPGFFWNRRWNELQTVILFSKSVCITQEFSDCLSRENLMLIYFAIGSKII